MTPGFQFTGIGHSGVIGILTTCRTDPLGCNAVTSLAHLRPQTCGTIPNASAGRMAAIGSLATAQQSFLDRRFRSLNRGRFLFSPDFSGSFPLNQVRRGNSVPVRWAKSGGTVLAELHVSESS
jgi:hypothetical protein